MSDYQTKEAAQKSAEAQQNEENAGKELLNSFANYGKSVYEHGKANVELAGAMLHDAGTYVADKAEDAYNGAVNAAQNAGNYVAEKAESAWTGITNTAMATGEYFSDKMNDAKDYANNKHNEFWADVEAMAQQAQGKTLEAPAAATAVTAGAEIAKAGIEMSETAKAGISKAKTMPDHKTTTAAEKSDTEIAQEDFLNGKDLPDQMPSSEKQKVIDQRRTALENKDKEHAETPVSEKDEQAEAERLDGLFKDALSGKFGNGDDRKEALGSDYEVIQSRINDYYAQKAQSELDTEDMAVAAPEMSAECGA